ncbi:hypothetical protein L484_016077 [Morus notabilis]|uniref:Uncharacterized protein n=1 Tax=Morus notabilis TaxID=981085 RepID=W9SUB6_9ROSA|nr:hypothetical protein L484_016077 [Morus notabilis]
MKDFGLLLMFSSDFRVLLLKWHIFPFILQHFRAKAHTRAAACVKTRCGSRFWKRIPLLRARARCSARRPRAWMWGVRGRAPGYGRGRAAGSGFAWFCTL